MPGDDHNLDPPASLDLQSILHLSPLHPHLAAAAKSFQSCPTLCDPIDGSAPGSSVPGILQARILEWVAIYFSNVSMHAKSLQSFPTLRPHGQQPSRLLWPQDSLGKNNGVGCHLLLPPLPWHRSIWALGNVILRTFLGHRLSSESSASSDGGRWRRRGACARLLGDSIRGAAAVCVGSSAREGGARGCRCDRGPEREPLLLCGRQGWGTGIRPGDRVPEGAEVPPELGPSTAGGSGPLGEGLPSLPPLTPPRRWWWSCQRRGAQGTRLPSLNPVPLGARLSSRLTDTCAAASSSPLSPPLAAGGGGAPSAGAVSSWATTGTVGE